MTWLILALCSGKLSCLVSGCLLRHGDMAALGLPLPHKLLLLGLRKGIAIIPVLHTVLWRSGCRCRRSTPECLAQSTDSWRQSPQQLTGLATASRPRIMLKKADSRHMVNSASQFLPIGMCISQPCVIQSRVDPDQLSAKGARPPLLGELERPPWPLSGAPACCSGGLQHASDSSRHCGWCAPATALALGWSSAGRRGQETGPSLGLLLTRQSCRGSPAHISLSLSRGAPVYCVNSSLAALMASRQEQSF